MLHLLLTVIGYPAAQVTIASSLAPLCLPSILFANSIISMAPPSG